MDAGELADVLKTVLAERGELALPPSGASMGPEFENALGLVVVPAARATIAVGSVVAFERHGRWVVHRVVDVSWKDGSPTYTTKGDAMSRVDAPRVESSEIVGVVVGLRSGKGLRTLAAEQGPLWRERVKGRLEMLKAAAARIRPSAPAGIRRRSGGTTEEPDGNGTEGL